MSLLLSELKSDETEIHLLGSPQLCQNIANKFQGKNQVLGDFHLIESGRWSAKVHKNAMKFSTAFSVAF